MQLLVTLFFIFLVVAGAVAAWRDDRFDPWVWPDDSGLTWASHWGMWCELVLMSVGIYFASAHIKEWLAYPGWLMFIFGVAVAISVALHFYWAATHPRCPNQGCEGVHVRHPNNTTMSEWLDAITPSGWVHVVYMALVITFGGAFYALSESVTDFQFAIFTMCAIVTVVVGTVQPMFYFSQLSRHPSPILYAATSAGVTTLTSCIIFTTRSFLS